MGGQAVTIVREFVGNRGQQPVTIGGHRSPTTTRWQLRSRKPMAAPQAVLTWIFAALSFLMIWTLFFGFVVSSLEEARSQRNLYGQFRDQLSQGIAPVGGAIAAGAPVAMIDLPSAGLHRTIVVEGTAGSDLTNGPGHRRDTPLPGQVGTSLIYGRQSLFGGPFGTIESIEADSVFTVTTSQGEFHYKVTDVRHVGDPLPVTLAAGQSRLTLVTASGNGWRDGWGSSHAVYVDATLQDKAVPTPPGRPSSVPLSEKSMHNDISAMYLIVLWLALLLIVAVIAVWLQQTWGRWQTWIVSLPVLIAGLWGLSHAAITLLPNLY